MLEFDLLRVDERLIHGQILVKWLRQKNIRRTLILDDELASDYIMQRVLAMAFPKEISLEIYSLKEGIPHLREEEGRICLLIRNLEILYALFRQGILMREVNLCRLPYSKGKQEIAEHLYVSAQEREILRELLDQKVELIVQMVPDSTPVRLRTLLESM